MKKFEGLSEVSDVFVFERILKTLKGTQCFVCEKNLRTTWCFVFERILKTHGTFDVLFLRGFERITPPPGFGT
mgnify:CR=1 FL=1